ncbi:MAG: histidinol-phosphate transaminase [archaeon]
MRKNLETIKPYAVDELDRKKYIRLDFMENTAGCSPKVIDAMKKINAKIIGMYPDYSGINNKLARVLGITKKKFILTNGSDEAIRLVIDAIVGEQEEIILIEPTFSMFDFYAKTAGANIVALRFKDNFSFPMEELLSSINAKTKLVILCNPNNPTGTIVDEKDIIDVADRLKEKSGGMLLVDEAYYEFSDITVLPYIIGCDNRNIAPRKNMIITRTFSKAWGLASLRIGLIIADETVIPDIKKIASPFSLNYAAVVALSAALDDKEYVKNYVDYVTTQRNVLEKKAEMLGFNVTPSYANFVLANFSDKADYYANAIMQKGILVKNLDKKIKGFLRISIGSEEEMTIFYIALAEIRLQLMFEKVDTILFDMDGVLVDVSNSYRVAIREAVNYFLKKNGIDKQITFEIIQFFKEKGRLNNDWDCSKAIIESYGITVPMQEIISKFDEICFGGAIDNEKLIVNLDMLSMLSKKYKLGIVTGRPRRDADYTIKKFGLDKYFSCIVTLDDVAKSKPDPEGIGKAINALGGKTCAYIGDTVDDIIAAKNALCISVGIIPPAASDNTFLILKNKGAEIVFDNINKLLEGLN